MRLAACCCTTATTGQLAKQHLAESTHVRCPCADSEPFGNPLYGSAPGSTPLRQSYDPDNNPVYSPQGEDMPVHGVGALLLLPPPPAEQLPAPLAPSGAVPLRTSAISLLSHDGKHSDRLKLLCVV